MIQHLERKFVKPSSISDALKCIICSEVYFEPTRLFCSHTFCFQCINKWQKAKNMCPVCRSPIDKKNIGPDRIAYSIVSQLEVFCPVEDCAWKGQNSFLDLHYENECLMRDKVQQKLKGKSYRKTKNFNMIIQDEQIAEKVNSNMIKGSLQGRLLAKNVSLGQIRPNNSKNNEEQQIQKIQKKQKQGSQQIKKTRTCDFLEDLFG